jgi:hypothetical protein
VWKVDNRCVSVLKIKDVRRLIFNSERLFLIFWNSVELKHFSYLNLIAVLQKFTADNFFVPNTSSFVYVVQLDTQYSFMVEFIHTIYN